MDRLTADLDRQLGEWLRDESEIRASAGLVEAVFARTSRTRQVRRWWPPASPFRSRSVGPHVLGRATGRFSWAGPGLVATVAIVLVVAVAGFVLRPVSLGPGGTPGGQSPSPSPSLEATPGPGPQETRLPDGTVVEILSLGRDAGPIDVVAAFDSIWVANLFSHDVSRIDPATVEETDRISSASGPAWFAVLDDSLWVTDQTGLGIVGINPATNLATTAVGDGTPCGAPVLAFDSLWVSACDSDVILRVDTAGLEDIVAGRRFPANDEIVTEISAAGYRWLAFAGGRLFTGNDTGLAEIDPTTESLTDIGICCGDIIGSDGQTIWLKRPTDVVRMDPTDGTVTATFPYANAGSVTFVDGRAWLTAGDAGVIEIDLASNGVLRTIPVPGPSLVARELDGVLWVTSFDTSDVWRIEP